jgi:hypothetical protein
MLIRKHVPKQEIKRLKMGDFFIDGLITFIQRNRNIVSIITNEDNLYNAHMKQGDYNLFRIDKYRRRLEREAGNQ